MSASKPDLAQALLSPLKAMTSRDFYFGVLFRMKGTGFLYLFLLCVVLAIPATWRTASVMHYFKSLGLPRLVAQIPPSYLDASGTLAPQGGGSSYAEIKNAQGEVVMVYNTDGKALSGAAADAPIEFGAKDMVIHNFKGGISLPYIGLFPTDTSFQPVQSAQALEGVLGASTQLIWSVLLLSMYMFLVFNALISACLSRFMMVFIFRIKAEFGATLRLCSYANTLVAFIMLAQFFVFLPMSYTVMALVPLVYVALFCQKFRAELAKDGINGFARRHGGAARVQGSGEDAQDQDGPRRDTSVYSGNMYAQEQERLKRQEERRRNEGAGGEAGQDEPQDGEGRDQDNGSSGQAQDGMRGQAGSGSADSSDDGLGRGDDDDDDNNDDKGGKGGKGGKGSGGYFEA